MTALAPAPSTSRLDYLDATRAFALLLGVVFHASLSFAPYFMGWAVQDISTGALVPDFLVVSHAFRMELFFLLAGFFGHALFSRQGAGPFLRSRGPRGERQRAGAGEKVPTLHCRLGPGAGMGRMSIETGQVVRG